MMSNTLTENANLQVTGSWGPYYPCPNPEGAASPELCLKEYGNHSHSLEFTAHKFAAFVHGLQFLLVFNEKDATCATCNVPAWPGWLFACEELVIGCAGSGSCSQMAKTLRLLLPFTAWTHDWKCERTFYVLSPQEAEVHAPELAQCALLQYAEALTQGLASSSCASDLATASIVVLPGYTFHNCHWPNYGGKCEEDALFRPGRACYDEQTMGAYRTIIDVAGFAGKAVAIIDGSGSVQKAWLPDLSFYNHPRLIILRLGAAVWFHRPGMDVSLPPGPLSRCAGSDATNAMMESLDAKHYLATFKGKLRHSHVRTALAKLHHNDVDVILVDRLDDSYDYDELLYSTVFSLILEGDMLQTFHFPEAVCSGGIPVLISSNWVPPLQELVPFETYGLRFRDDELPELMVRLRALDTFRRIWVEEVMQSYPDMYTWSCSVLVSGS